MAVAAFVTSLFPNKLASVTLRCVRKVVVPSAASELRTMTPRTASSRIAARPSSDPG